MALKGLDVLEVVYSERSPLEKRAAVNADYIVKQEAALLKLLAERKSAYLSLAAEYLPVLDPEAMNRVFSHIDNSLTNLLNQKSETLEAVAPHEQGLLAERDSLLEQQRVLVEESAVPEKKTLVDTLVFWRKKPVESSNESRLVEFSRKLSRIEEGLRLARSVPVRSGCVNGRLKEVFSDFMSADGFSGVRDAAVQKDGALAIKDAKEIDERILETLQKMERLEKDRVAHIEAVDRLDSFIEHLGEGFQSSMFQCSVEVEALVQDLVHSKIDPKEATEKLIPLK